VSRGSLKPGGTLDRYVGALFVTSYATALFVVVGLFLVLDLANYVDEYTEPMKDGSAKPIVWIVRYYVLHLPFLFLQVAPFVTLVASLFTVSKLLKHNEVVAALGAGVSAQRLLAPVVTIAAFTAVGVFTLRETITVPLGTRRDAIHYVLDKGVTDQVYKNLFLKDLTGSNVHLVEFRPATGEPPFAEVRGLSAYLPSQSNLVTIQADRAVYVRRGDRAGWRLEHGVRTELSGKRPVDFLEGFDFTPELALTFARAKSSPLELSYSQTREMTRRDPDNVVYQTLLQYHVTFPLANLVLVLVGVPLLMRYERRRGAASLGAACLLCISFFATDLVFRNLGMQAAMDPRMAVWMPIVLFGSLGIVLYDSMRT